MKAIKLLLLFSLFLVLFNSYAQNTWTQKANFGGGARRDAFGFNIGNKGYLGAGVDSIEGKKDFWEYDPVSNVWTQKADFADERRYAVGFSIGNYGYAGTGVNAVGSTNDFWQYDPVANTWKKKASFLGGKRYWATGFSIGGKGYLGTGVDNAFKKDFYEYDPVANTWTQKAYVPSTRAECVGFSIGNKGYIATGNIYETGATNELVEYDPATDHWTQKASCPGAPRVAAAGFAMNGKGYIGSGFGVDSVFTNIFFNDFWEYDQLTDSWAEKATFPGEYRSNAVGFAVGSKGYIGTGQHTFPSFLNDFWEYAPDCLPPTGLTATNITSTNATLGWNTATGALKYNVRYKMAGGNPWITASSFSTSKNITGLAAGSTYTWQVKSVCSTVPHVFSDWSPKQSFTTSLRLGSEEQSVNPDVYPNPFSSSTTLSFFIEKDSHTTIDLFDLTGQKIKTLLDENLEAGDHLFQLNREQIASGIYLLQIKKDDQTSAMKIIVE